MTQVLALVKVFFGTTPTSRNIAANSHSLLRQAQVQTDPGNANWNSQSIVAAGRSGSGVFATRRARVSSTPSILMIAWMTVAMRSGNWR